jgi:hypothetical protein
MPRPRRDEDAITGLPRPRMLRIDRGFVVGLLLVGVAFFWLKGESPPGFPGEPDLTRYRGAPLLVVYGAPWCRDCEPEWRRLRTRLPESLAVVHLVTSTEAGYGHPADAATAAAWAARLGVAAEQVLPADLTAMALPAVSLRDHRGRERLRLAGRIDPDRLLAEWRRVAPPTHTDDMPRAESQE